MEARGASARGGGGVAEADQRGHDVGGRDDVLRIADKQADAGAVDAGGVDRRRLGEDDVGIAGDGEVSDGAEVEREAANADGGGALGLARQVGDVRRAACRATR